MTYRSMLVPRRRRHSWSKCPFPEAIPMHKQSIGICQWLHRPHATNTLVMYSGYSITQLQNYLNHYRGRISKLLVKTKMLIKQLISVQINLPYKYLNFYSIFLFCFLSELRKSRKSTNSIAQNMSHAKRSSEI